MKSTHTELDALRSAMSPLIESMRRISADHELPVKSAPLIKAARESALNLDGTRNVENERVMLETLVELLASQLHYERGYEVAPTMRPTRAGRAIPYRREWVRFCDTSVRADIDEWAEGDARVIGAIFNGTYHKAQDLGDAVVAELAAGVDDALDTAYQARTA